MIHETHRAYAFCPKSIVYDGGRRKLHRNEQQHLQILLTYLLLRNVGSVYLLLFQHSHASVPLFLHLIELNSVLPHIRHVVVVLRQSVQNFQLNVLMLNNRHVVAAGCSAIRCRRASVCSKSLAMWINRMSSPSCVSLF